MAMKFKQLSASERSDFLADSGQRSVSTHRLTKHCFHWPYCSRCGLVALKNKPTRKALKKPCVVYL